MQKFKLWLIKKLGGYTKQDLLTKQSLRLFNSIQADDILKEIATGEWKYRNKTILPANQKRLIAEAKVFSESKLWEVLQNDIKYLANKKMFVTSVSTDDLVAGKLWLLTLDAMNTRIKSLTKGSGMMRNN
jgi:hypothetical protein